MGDTATGKSTVTCRSRNEHEKLFPRLTGPITTQVNGIHATANKMMQILTRFAEYFALNSIITIAPTCLQDNVKHWKGTV